MEQNKRRHSIADNHMKKKFIVEPKSLAKTSIAQFEDLSNELIYEIFDILDFCQVYDIFFNLNIRFRNLLTHSTLPIHIKLLFASKLNFQRYYTQIILPNQYRIQSLHLSNPFHIEHLFSPRSITLQLTQLETLIINEIESTNLENLLNYLLVLPHLSSLVIISLDRTVNNNKFIHQIFRLPVLTYCKLSFKESGSSGPLPLATNEFSSIEHLVIICTHALDDLHALLSYIPHLTRLSIHCPYRCDMQGNFTTLMHLTHVFLNGPDIPFDQLESISRYLFNQVQVLHISTCYSTAYLNANRWQNLIIYNMPHLRVFDMSVSYILQQNENIVDYINMMNRFYSSFWFERQWFFEYHVYEGEDQIHLRFFSTKPFRRRKYTLYEKKDEGIDINTQEGLMESVHQLQIWNEKVINDCRNDFPNVTQLTIFSHPFEQSTNLLSISLRNIIPLIRLTKIVFHSFNYDFSKIIELFQYTPNIQTFEIGYSSLTGSNLVSIEESEAFQFVSQKNTIRNMIIGSGYTMEEIKFLIHLCPRLYQLSINKPDNDFQPLLRLLLSSDPKKLNYLFLLCVTYIFPEEITSLKTFIKSEKSLDKCSLQIKYDRSNSSVYLWW